MDIKQQITDRIIKHMETAGDDWKRPWTLNSRQSRPHNGITGKAYQGVNWFVLALSGYPFGDWYTYKQAASLGAQVRRGEKATQGIFFSPVKKTDKSTGDEKSFLLVKAFHVFNRAQIDGLPELEKVDSVAPVINIAAADEIVDRSGARIVHGGDRAFYVPSDDYIAMPQVQQFHKVENYHAIRFHELTHWTGHKSRLDRVQKFSGDDYAFEELIAELGSALLSGLVGIVDSTVDGHAKYLNHWIKGLRDDKNAFFKAASHAYKAYDYLTGTQDQQEESTV